LELCRLLAKPPVTSISSRGTVRTKVQAERLTCAEGRVYRSAVEWTEAIVREAIDWSATKPSYELDEPCL